MAGLTREDLTQEQQAAIEAWWVENDPDGYTYEYADTFRYAIEGNAEHEAVYEDIRHSGCCGSMDVALPLPDGTVLLYGFNYGH